MLTEKLPLTKFNKSLFTIPKSIQLGDENYNEPKQIDVLLGAEIFYELIGSGKLKLGNHLPVIQETLLGWVISDNLAFLESKNQKTVCNISHVSNNTLNEMLNKFWQVEEHKDSKFL